MPKIITRAQRRRRQQPLTWIGSAMTYRVCLAFRRRRRVFERVLGAFAGVLRGIQHIDATATTAFAVAHRQTHHISNRFEVDRKHRAELRTNHRAGRSYHDIRHCSVVVVPAHCHSTMQQRVNGPMVDFARSCQLNLHVNRRENDERTVRLADHGRTHRYHHGREAGSLIRRTH